MAELAALIQRFVYLRPTYGRVRAGVHPGRLKYRRVGRCPVTAGWRSPQRHHDTPSSWCCRQKAENVFQLHDSAAEGASLIENTLLRTMEFIKTKAYAPERVGFQVLSLRQLINPPIFRLSARIDEFSCTAQ
jgi:hypothetical protein